MGPRLQPTVERLVDPNLAASHMGPDQMVTVGPVQVITPRNRCPIRESQFALRLASMDLSVNQY